MRRASRCFVGFPVPVAAAALKIVMHRKGHAVDLLLDIPDSLELGGYLLDTPGRTGERGGDVQERYDRDRHDEQHPQPDQYYESFLYFHKLSWRGVTAGKPDALIPQIEQV